MKKALALAFAFIFAGIFHFQPDLFVKIITGLDHLIFFILRHVG